MHPPLLPLPRLTRLTLLLSLSLSFAQHRFTLSPLTTSPNTPTPRADHLTVVIQSADSFLIIIHGGRDRTTVKSDTWIYVVSQNRWVLLAPPALANSQPPPPLWGAVGGYRFVDRNNHFPYLYVTMGVMSNGTVTNRMWAMELNTYTWRQVRLIGHVPQPRYAAAGSLERFVKPDGTARPMLILSHGYGQHGPLSDTFKCVFHPTDPYTATWRRFKHPVGMYHANAPHPTAMMASSFTSARDLVMFGGCYASTVSGGLCPSWHAWVLEYRPELLRNSTDGRVEFAEGTDSVKWNRLPVGPAPRIGAAMAQGLNAFKAAYEGQRDIAVLYSGVQTGEDVGVDHALRMTQFDGGEIDIVSTSAREWSRERVFYQGPQELRNESMQRRRGASLSIVRSGEGDDRLQLDDANEFFILFGGQFENGSYTNALLKLAFDPFLESELVHDSVAYVTRPFVHGLLMFISWGVLMVIAVFMARYKKDDSGRPRYVLLHVGIQVVALAVAWAGFAVAVYGRRNMTGRFAHAHIGVALMVLASLQPIAAAVGILVQLKSTPRLSTSPSGEAKLQVQFVPRLCRAYHRVMSLVVMLLGALNISLGLLLIVAPTIFWVQWVVYSCVLVFCALWLEVIGGRRKDQIQTRASSMNHGVMSRGSSTLGRIVRSFRGESTASVLRRSRTLRQDGSIDDDEISASKSLKDEEILAEEDTIESEQRSRSWSRSRSWGKSLRSKASEESQSDSERPWDGPGDSAPEPRKVIAVSRQEIDPMQERVQDVLESPERIDSMIEGRDRVNSTASSSVFSYRERLDSGVSSMYSYHDPDSY